MAAFGPLLAIGQQALGQQMVSVASEVLRVEGPVMRQRGLPCLPLGSHTQALPHSPFLPIYLRHSFPTVSPV